MRSFLYSILYSIQSFLYSCENLYIYKSYLCIMKVLSLYLWSSCMPLMVGLLPVNIQVLSRLSGLFYSWVLRIYCPFSPGLWSTDCSCTVTHTTITHSADECFTYMPVHCGFCLRNYWQRNVYINDMDFLNNVYWYELSLLLSLLYVSRNPDSASTIIFVQVILSQSRWCVFTR